jgi:hypothetical protein
LLARAERFPILTQTANQKQFEVFIMATEHKNKKASVKVCLAMSVCLLVILGGIHSQAQATPIVGWGYNGHGQATPPAGYDFVDIAAGSSHSLALKDDGSVVGWGKDNYGQATPPAGNDFVAIAAGGSHNLAIMIDGSVLGWGWDFSGQATPPGGNDFVAIAAGAYHSLALKVEDPGELISRLAQDVEDLNLQRGISNSLEAKLDTVLKALTDVNQNNDAAAIGALGAFVNAVDAQRGKKIPEEDADDLIAQAQHIIFLLM